MPSAPAKDTWRVKALIASAVAAVREIQALQAPHIADAEDSAMAGLEQRMAAAEAAARKDLATLQILVAPAARSHVGDATTALDRFMGLNAQIVALSRRNTNVRSLALSLDQKRKLIGPCEETLRALRDSRANTAIHRTIGVGGSEPPLQERLGTRAEAVREPPHNRREPPLQPSRARHL